MYGYSVWLVPLNHRILTKVYKFQHVPHVTISTNHVKIPEPDNLGRLYDIVKFQTYSTIEKQYVIDPLHSIGWKCSVDGLDISHVPHLTHRYSFYSFPDTVTPVFPTPRYLIGEVVVADTRSPRWEEWKIIKEKKLS